MALISKIKKLSKQWSTHKGLILVAGAALGVSEVALAYEAINQVLIGATGLIGLHEIFKDDEKPGVQDGANA